MTLSTKLEARLASARVQRDARSSHRELQALLNQGRVGRRRRFKSALRRFFGGAERALDWQLDAMSRNGYGQRDLFSGFFSACCVAALFVGVLAVLFSFGMTVPSFVFPAIIGLGMWVSQSKN